MNEKRINSVKGIFNRNSKNNLSNNNNISGKNKSYNPKKVGNRKNPYADLNPNQLKKLSNQSKPVPKQKELSELDTVLLQRMREIENVIGKLVADVQYLDSKTPAASSKMTKIVVELIYTLWTIGNIATEYQKNNQMAVVNNLLLKNEERLLKLIENPKTDTAKLTGELNEVRASKKIINDSLRPINIIVDYYEMIILKLSSWGYEIKDPIGQKYDAYMDIDVIAFENGGSDLKVPTITETKKPEIYYKDNKILRAQVIVTNSNTKNNVKHENN